MLQIPFHSLVFCREQHRKIFPPHEWMSHQSICHDLVGDDDCALPDVVFAELRHRLSLKLSLGQRVAILADDLLGVQRQSLAALATTQGAEAIDLETPSVHLSRALPRNPLDHLRAHWKGITIVGDVHGDLAALNTVIEWAEARQNFLWLLGDVIDYGADTLATSDLAYRAVMHGNAAMVLGNHERKIARWLDNSGRSHLRISDGNRVTIQALNALKPALRKQWSGRFRALLAHASLMQQIDNVTLVHAAVHPTLWDDQPNTGLVKEYALYGESDHSGGKFRRVHRWINAVPSGQWVFIGHDVMAELPTVVTGTKGGKVVFLDTGCGNGGHLSSADLRFTDSGLRLECFNRH